MLKTNVGSSLNPNPALAGAEAAKAAKSGITDIKVAFVYSGVQYDQSELLKSIATELPGVPLIGNTSFTGVITPEGFIGGDDGFVGVFLIGGDISVGIAGNKKINDARSTGVEVAKSALAAAGKDSSAKVDAPDYFYMVANPGEEEFFLKGIEDVIGRVPFFGGSAADNTITGQWSLFTSDMIEPEGVAVAFFWTDEAKGFANLFTGAYNETDKFGIITKVVNNRELVEIDGVPAVKKYAEWRGMSTDQLMGGDLLVQTITAPLGIKDRLGDLIAIRHPMNGNDDFSMAVGANLAEKTTVIMMDGDVDHLIKVAGENVTAAIEKLGKTPAGLHLVHCGGRRAGIGDRINELYDSIKNAAGDIPFIVVFTFGEYGYEDDDRNTTGGLMLSYSAFA